jgi:hypothetical protein
MKNLQIIIVSDEEIKEGDWVYITLKPSICQYKANMPEEWCKKIIAIYKADKPTFGGFYIVADNSKKLAKNDLCLDAAINLFNQLKNITR